MRILVAVALMSCAYGDDAALDAGSDVAPKDVVVEVAGVDVVVDASAPSCGDPFSGGVGQDGQGGLQGGGAGPLAR